MKILFYISLVVYLFFGVNVLQHFGWNIELNKIKLYETLLPSFYSFSLIFATKIFQGTSFLKQKKEEKNILYIVIAAALFQFSIGHGGFLGNLVNCLITPILLSCLMLNKYHRFLHTDTFSLVKKIIIIFFIFEFLLALYERIAFINVFPFHDEIYGNKELLELEIHEFRSTALQNAPLQNALCMSIIMSFILISSIKYYYKYLLWAIGYISLLCFNTRSSIIGWAILFIIHVIYVYTLKGKFLVNQKIVLTAFLISIVTSIYILVARYGWGGRLINKGIYNDSSAQVRIQIWDIFKYFNIEYFLWGIPNATIYLITKKIGIDIIENYWFIYLFRYGVVFTILFLIFFTRLFSRLLKKYSFFQKAFVLSCFLLISSTNNSLAVATPALSLFILCSYVFAPHVNRI